MKICLACFEGRLASLFENAPAFPVFDIDGNKATPAGELKIPAGDALALATAMADAEVPQLICGGISEGSSALLVRQGVAVTSWISGSVEEVLNALASNNLESLIIPGARTAIQPPYGGRGMGRGNGMGRGMGFGGGRGIGGRVMGSGGRGMGGGRGNGGGRGMRSNSGAQAICIGTDPGAGRGMRGGQASANGRGGNTDGGRGRGPCGRGMAMRRGR